MEWSVCVCNSCVTVVCCCVQMEWSLVGRPERVGPVEVEDIRKDLLRDFTALPTKVQSENLQVFLRIRPFTSAESDSGDTQDCVAIEGSDTVILKAPRTNKSLPQTGQRFSFTQVFSPDSSQRAVFEGSVRSRVRDVLDGGNCLVFTYGVTNAGKTFTFLGPDHDLGLLPRSLAVIFNSLEGRLYSRCDLKPLRCRDYTRLTPDQQNLESATKRTLLKLFKETDKSLTSGKSTFLDGSNVTDSSLSSSSEHDSFVLDVDDSVKFSVWVSFCEIYNDNIHDLLEHVPHGHQKRTVLRLSQDVKGNSFIKDLRWVQVNSSDEAYRVMKIGKKNQSISATRLNQLSSRSHSIFSIRLMKIDDVGVPRVVSISELALCDLAGSERCSRTQNCGERLKEAGNINSSLLTLSKCISAMRSKFQQHVPFRESKLTHFLQFFFCGSGSGKVTMVVNINQSSSSLDETLNVLKFSALAQKVVVLTARPAPLDAAPHRSAMELSLIIDEAETRRFRGRKSSMVWERSLEDVLETDDGHSEEEEEEQSEMEDTVLEAANTTMENTQVTHTHTQSVCALRLVLEAQIREEVSAEFMELFNKMEKDYSERLEKEREILEERAEKRVEILKNLVHRTVDLSALERQVRTGADRIHTHSQNIHTHTQNTLTHTEYTHTHTKYTHTEYTHSQNTHTLRIYTRTHRIHSLTHKEYTHTDTEYTHRYSDSLLCDSRSVVESVRAELMKLQQNCSCLRRQGDETRERGDEERKRPRGSSEDETAPAKKRVLLEEEIWRLHEENDQKEHLICELRQQRDQEETRLNQTITRLQEEETRLNQTITRLQEEETRLNQTSGCVRCDSVFESLESEQRETSRLDKENKALVKGMFQLQNQ
ncbi:hypothetical protein NL108_016032, partial [Boleophthalmus pectinirostris]